VRANNTSTQPAASSSQAQTKGPTPVPDRSLPPHLAGRSAAATPPPAGANGKESPAPKTNGAADKKDDKEKAKPKNAKKDAAKKDGAASTGAPTPETPATPVVQQDGSAEAEAEGVKSPGDGSTGARTPKTGKPPRHPWTVFMRMAPQIQISEAEIREFFGEAREGVSFPFFMFLILFLLSFDFHSFFFFLAWYMRIY
jgi:hypothetical protein